MLTTMSPWTIGVVAMPAPSTYAVTSSIAELAPDWQMTGSDLGGIVWHSTASASDSLAAVTLSLPAAGKHTTALIYHKYTLSYVTGQPTLGSTSS